ncbi:MAG: hypothetical protein HPY60_05300 [Candidatus Methanofastidiosum sp.]|nr:hypothetical protein [Methanofastidiosum sp.]
MKGKIAILISLLIVVSFISGCTTSEVFVNNSEFYGCVQEPVVMDEELQNGLNQIYEGYLAECQQECPTCNCEADAKIETFMGLADVWIPGLLGKRVTLPFSYNIDRCSPSQHYRLNNADLGMDIRKCPELTMNINDSGLSIYSLPYTSFLPYALEYIDIPITENGCIPTSFKNQNLPPNSKCQLKEDYLLVITSESPNLILNGNGIKPLEDETSSYYTYILYFYSGWDKALIDDFLANYPSGPFDLSGVYAYNEIPSSINITYDKWEGQPTTNVFLYRECCWHCNPKPSLPATILYPKVDIESFTLTNGDAIVKDGKIISSFTVAPGVQNTTIGVENRGFFTQNNVYIKFVGLPEGIEASTMPELQKIKAHNIGTYETTFTVEPNVPSGTYKISLIAYSQNGILDTIIMDLVIP